MSDSEQTNPADVFGDEPQTTEDSTDAATDAVEAQPDSQVTPETDAEDKALDAILGQDADDESSEPPDSNTEPDEDESETEDASASETDEEEPETDPEGEDEPGDEDVEGYSSAVEDLKRSGLPLSAIKSMEPEVAIEYADRLRKQRSSADRLATELADLKKAREQDDAVGHPDEQSDADLPSSAEMPESIRSALDAIRGDDFAGGVGDKLEQVIVGLWEATQKQTVADPTQTPAFLELQQRFDAAELRVEQLQLDKARVHLESDFPQLKDADSYSKVTDAMRKLSRVRDDDGNPMFASMEDLMETAATQVFAKDILAEKQASKRKRDQQRNAGNATPDVTNRSKARAMTREQIEDRIADMALAGKSQDEIRRWKDEQGVAA